MESGTLQRVREICMAFPEVAEREGNAYCFRVREKNFVVFWPNWFSDPRPSVWYKAPSGAQDELVTSDRDRFFVPAWMGRHGWVGVRLEPPPDDWDELAMMFQVAYRMTAPKRLSAQLGGPD